MGQNPVSNIPPQAALKLLGGSGGRIPRFVLVAEQVVVSVIDRDLPKCHPSQNSGPLVPCKLPNVSKTINWRRVRIFRCCF